MAEPVIPVGSVIITPNEMYNEMRATREEVQHLSALLDPAISDIRADVSDHENRLRALEKRMWMWVGASAVGGGGVVALVNSALGVG